MKRLDQYDRQILKELQQDAHINHQELADRVSLSKTACWRRVQKLEQNGLIRGYVALLNPDSLGLNVMAYVQVSMLNHDVKTLDTFNTFIEGSPFVMECCAITGNYDYILKVVASDTQELETFLMRKLLSLGVVKSTNSNFILGQRKNTTELPISA